jgi:hypothetical protein
LKQATSQLTMWVVVVLCAPAGLTMLLAVPSVLSAYGAVHLSRVRFSVGCCALLFLSFAWVPFLVLVGVVGGWLIIVADMYMLVALCGVPEHRLMGNKVNMGAYTTLRFMCQGLIQALPFALISTAAIDATLAARPSAFGRFARHANNVLWASLLLSLSRFAWEVLSLAALTYRLQAPCFVTAIVDVVHHLQPQPASSSCGVAAPPGSPCPEGLHDAHPEQAGVANLISGRPLCSSTQATPGAQAALTCMPAGGAGPAADQAGAEPTQTVVQLHSSSSGVEGLSCCSSWGTCWPQQYPRFTVVYVWVVSLLVVCFVCVVCSHIIRPWLFLDAQTAAALQPYSLLGLWGNWRLSGSVRGSLAAVGSCHLWEITCSLKVP